MSDQSTKVKPTQKQIISAAIERALVRLRVMEQEVNARRSDLMRLKPEQIDELRSLAKSNRQETTSSPRFFRDYPWGDVRYATVQFTTEVPSSDLPQWYKDRQEEIYRLYEQSAPISRAMDKLRSKGAEKLIGDSLSKDPRSANLLKQLVGMTFDLAMTDDNEVPS